LRLGKGRPLDHRAKTDLLSLVRRREELLRKPSAIAGWIPGSVENVAYVGQNLNTLLEQIPVKRLIRKQATKKTHVILVLQHPVALWLADPGAALDMRDLSTRHLDHLAAIIPAHLHRFVKVVFHPGSTLSLVAVDWTSRETSRRIAVITPKLQVDRMHLRRPSLVLRGWMCSQIVSTNLQRLLEDAEAVNSEALSSTSECRAFSVDLARASSSIEMFLGARVRRSRPYGRIAAIHTWNHRDAAPKILRDPALHRDRVTHVVLSANNSLQTHAVHVRPGGAAHVTPESPSASGSRRGWS
jgi:hypothetical protein